jgi:hypothetical protein
MGYTDNICERVQRTVFFILYSGVCNNSFVLVDRNTLKTHFYEHPSCAGHATPARSDMLHCPELKRASCYSNPLTFPISRKSSSCKLHPYFKKCVGVSVLVNCTPLSRAAFRISFSRSFLRRTSVFLPLQQTTFT